VRYYVETDGRIYLTPSEEGLDLPRTDEIPFDVDRIAPLAGDDDVWFCSPHLEEHPRGWPSKDHVQDRHDATARVRAAVHATMPRVVVEGICLRDGQVLLVKGSRGLTEGLWTLPGGFLRFGETPEDGVLREIREEVGIEGEVEDLVAVRSKLGRRTRLHWVMLFYRIATAGVPQPRPDEIAEASFVDMDVAARMLGDEVMASIVQHLE